MSSPHQGRSAPALRPLVAHDHPAVIDRIGSWWSDSRTPEQASELSLLVPRLFVDLFGHTSLALEIDDHLCGFLVGLHPAKPVDQAYIHLVGVEPRLRGRRIGRTLYAAFIRAAAREGRHDVRAITSPANRGSIDFHAALGFQLLPGDTMIGKVPVHRDYDGPGQDRVCFRRSTTNTTWPLAPETPIALDE